jgi:hypothetical protein
VTPLLCAWYRPIAMQMRMQIQGPCWTSNFQVDAACRQYKESRGKQTSETWKLQNMSIRKSQCQSHLRILVSCLFCATLATTGRRIKRAQLPLSLARAPSIMSPSLLRLVGTCLVLWAFVTELTTAFQVTGATGGVNLTTGARPFRHEINSFATSGAPYDLFILALRQLQSTNQSSPLSFFQIAGIHGYPQLPWDGVQGNPFQPAGYCMHFCPAFSTWHRPYMALYEVVAPSFKLLSLFTDDLLSSKLYGTMHKPLRAPTQLRCRTNT